MIHVILLSGAAILTLIPHLLPGDTDETFYNIWKYTSPGFYLVTIPAMILTAIVSAMICMFGIDSPPKTTDPEPIPPPNNKRNESLRTRYKARR